MQNHLSNAHTYSDLSTMAEHFVRLGFPLTAKYLEGIVGLARKLSVKYGKSQMEHDFAQVALAAATNMEKSYLPGIASFYTYINKPIKAAIQENFGNPNRTTKKYKQIQAFIDSYDKKHGMYPDVDTIATGTGMSHFDVLSIYYDKYNTVAIDDVNEFAVTMEDPFSISSFSWINEHYDVLSKKEQNLIDAVYTYGMTIKDAASAEGLSIKEAKDVHSTALEKLRNSISEYE